MAKWMIKYVLFLCSRRFLKKRCLDIIVPTQLQHCFHTVTALLFL